MRRLTMIIIALIMALLSATSCVAVNGINKIKGSGELTERTISIPDFSSVDASNGVQVILSQTQAEGKATIEADDNVIEFVELKVEDRELKVEMEDDRSYSNITVIVKVAIPENVVSLEASSGSRIASESVLKGANIDIDVSSGANVSVAVDATQCDVETTSGSRAKVAMRADVCTVEATSGSNATLTGEVTSLTVKTSSGAAYRGYDLVSKDCNVASSSGSSARVAVTEHLQARASSGASIRYDDKGSQKLTSTFTNGVSKRK